MLNPIEKFKVALLHMKSSRSHFYTWKPTRTLNHSTCSELTGFTQTCIPSMFYTIALTMSPLTTTSTWYITQLPVTPICPFSINYVDKGSRDKSYIKCGLIDSTVLKVLAFWKMSSIKSPVCIINVYKCSCATIRKHVFILAVLPSVVLPMY